MSSPTTPESKPTVWSVLSHPFRNLMPPTPMGRKLAIQSLITASGGGAFNTVSAVFLLKVLDLRPGQVGLALTIALVARFVFAYPTGRIVDYFGPRRVWWVSAFARAALFVAMPFVPDFAAYLLVAIAFEAFDASGESANHTYVLNALSAEELVETRAHMYSSLNIGFTLGALIGGVALAFDSDTVVRWTPLFSAVLMAANAAWILRLPLAAHDQRAANKETRGERPPGPSAVKNIGWWLTSALVSTLWTNQVLLNIVIPLWLVAQTDAPQVLLAWLFATNTVACIFLPPYLTRMGRTLPTALKAVGVSTAFFVVSCLITMATHTTTGWLTILLIWIGHMTVTGAELAISSATWTFFSELTDPRRRGEYDGVGNVARGIGSMWAPALYTWLAMEWHGGLGWLVIAGIVVAAGAGLGPASAMAKRFADEHFPPAEEPDTASAEGETGPSLVAEPASASPMPAEA